MSLPSVEWRYVGTNSINSGTVDVLMDKIYDIAIATGYIDGSSRTQGSGSAGTWSRYQTGGGITEAIYVTPPSGSHKIIIAGSSGTPSPSPTMLSPDTYLVNTVLVNVIKNAGAFDAWNAANPFTSGNATGYSRFLGSRSSAGAGITNITGNVYLYESKESIAVFFITSTGTSSTSFSNGLFAGALWDPESTNSADCETDGRLYGLITSGHFITAGSNWTVGAGVWPIDQFNQSSPPAAGFVTRHNTTSGASHIAICNIGTSGTRTANLMMYPLTTGSSSSLITPSGKYARIPLIYRFADTSQVAGRLREVSLCQRGIIGQRHMNGGSTIGHVVCCSDYAPTPADSILLEY